VTAPSHDQAYEQGRVTALIKRPDLLLSPGDVADLPAREGAAMADLLIGHHAGRIRALYLDGAEGDDLSTLTRSNFGVERQAASQAVGAVTFSHTPGPTGTIPAGFRVATVPDTTGTFVTFVTDADLVFAAPDAAKSVNVTAIVGGPAGNVAAATLTRMLDTPFGSFTVTNQVACAGGGEEETDQELRERVRGYNATLRRGTLAALQFGALQVATVRVASVVEDPGTGIVTVYVSDRDGGSNSTMTAAVAAELEKWRAASIVVNVVGAILSLQSISVTLTVRVGVDVAALVDAGRQSIVAAVRRLQVGEVLYRDYIASAARAVAPDSILGVTVNTPAANLAPAANQVIRTTTDLVEVA